MLSGFNRLVEEFQLEYPEIADRPADPVRAMENSPWSPSGTLNLTAYCSKRWWETGWNTFFEMLRSTCPRSSKSTSAPSNKTRQLRSRFDLLAGYLVSSFLAVLVWWLDHDVDFSAEQMNAIFTQLVALASGPAQHVSGTAVVRSL